MIESDPEIIVVCDSVIDQDDRITQLDVDTHFIAVSYGGIEQGSFIDVIEVNFARGENLLTFLFEICG